MKFAKLSLAAIMAMSVSAFADVQNIKVSGDAKLYYSTTDTGDNDLFSQDNSIGQAAFDLSASASLANGVAAKIGLTSVSTLGLENNLVANTWAAKNTQKVLDRVKTQWWVNEAWLAKSFGKTTVKVGRQELDTPLAFSEKWNIAANTFDAAVVLNQDIPDTTLVAAWVGRGNGVGKSNAPLSDGSVVNAAVDGADPFRTYGSAIIDTADNSFTHAGVAPTAGGAYAVGAVTTAIPMTTAQAWYYNVVNLATAYWLQADVALEDQLKGLTIGVQYANINPDSKVDTFVGTNVKDSIAWAAKVGYAMDNGLKVSAAYSSTDEDGKLNVSNTATGLYSQSKLYTEAWWTYGEVSAPDTDSFNITAEYSMNDVADFGLYYTSADHATGDDMTEIAVTASKSFGALDTTLAFINVDKATNDNTVQVYLTYNF